MEETMRVMMLPALVAAGLMACTPGETERRSGDPDESGMAARETASTGTPTGTNAPGLSGVFSRLELANTAEIETSRLVAEKARSAEVKQLARRILDHHVKNRSELEALAKKKNVDVLPPAGGTTARDTSGVLALRGLEGAALDSAYVESQIEAHRANIDAIRNQMLPSTDDADVRQFLQKTVASMEEHLTGLEQAQGKAESS
jgi:putative membrane protein